tara:strand:+ start:234 stop:437 length:204 start_codon:yes stop_codon:yes gene_type:complete
LKKVGHFEKWIKSKDSSKLVGKEKTEKIATYWRKSASKSKRKKSKSKPEIGLVYKTIALKKKELKGE